MTESPTPQDSARDLGSDDLVRLGDYLRRVLVRALPGRFSSTDLDDVVQEALARVLAGRSSFRGESRFSTWAASVAIRSAQTELRRRRSREDRTRGLEALDFEPGPAIEDRTPEPVAILEGEDLLGDLREAIRSCLSDRQRFAIMAELRGIPTVTIAERLGTNQNALYKLVHDARKRLKAALVAAGHDEDSISAGIRRNER
ncbi:MAG: sigma-70 family RNA polymerase sigma factor [Planctomycetes bacterium]|nr:sigma-70 family RNA polymerase sigma factor [Planctomycetota bacterium]